MQPISSLVGVLLFLTGTIGYFISNGGDPVLVFLIDLKTIIAVTLAPLGSSIMAFGFRAVWEAILSFRFFFINPPANVAAPKSIVVIRFLTLSTYAIGGLMFLFGLMQVFTYPLNQLAAIRASIDSICVLIYPIFITEGLLRPLKSRLECLAERNG